MRVLQVYCTIHSRRRGRCACACVCVCVCVYAFREGAHIQHLFTSTEGWERSPPASGTQQYRRGRGGEPLLTVLLNSSASAPLLKSSTATSAPSGKLTTLCHCCLPKSTASKTKHDGSNGAGASDAVAAAIIKGWQRSCLFQVQGVLRLNTESHGGFQRSIDCTREVPVRGVGM